jgi:hypothetical protein
LGGFSLRDNNDHKHNYDDNYDDLNGSNDSVRDNNDNYRDLNIGFFDPLQLLCRCGLVDEQCLSERRWVHAIL